MQKNIIVSDRNGKTLQDYLRRCNNDNLFASWRIIYEDGTIVEKKMVTSEFNEVISGIPYGYIPEIKGIDSEGINEIQIFVSNNREAVWSRKKEFDFDFTDNSIIGYKEVG